MGIVSLASSWSPGQWTREELFICRALFPKRWDTLGCATHVALRTCLSHFQHQQILGNYGKSCRCRGCLQGPPHSYSVSLRHHKWTSHPGDGVRQ